MLALLPTPFNASLRPMFPKQTQLQNKTDRIQMPPSRLSLLTSPNHVPDPKASPPTLIGWCRIVEFAIREVLAVAGLGIISGFDTSRRVVPIAPTAAESIKPGLERSMRYHSAGLTRASVREACRVEVQGSLRCQI